MMVTFVSQCEKKALNRTRRVLDSFANRIGDNAWQTVITNEGLNAVKKLLRKTASKNTAVACHWIKSRSRSEFLWVVGNKNKFNNEGVVPVSRTQKDIIHGDWENNWQHAESIQILAVLTALLHDIGKATFGFQNKLNPDAERNYGDPYRHEWVSFRLFQAMISGCRDDESCLKRLINFPDFMEENPDWLNVLKNDSTQNSTGSAPLSDLPPLAQLIGWLIVSHHRLPFYEGVNYSKSSSRNKEKRRSFYLGKTINDFYKDLQPVKGWVRNSKSTENDEETEFWSFEFLPMHSKHWQSKLTCWARKALNHSPLMALAAQPIGDPFIMHLARMCVMVGDHNYSSLDKEDRRRVKGDINFIDKLAANTDRKTGKKKQALDEHLLGVGQFTARFARLLPQFSRKLPTLDEKHRPFMQPTGNRHFKWQNRAYDLARMVNGVSQECGFFGVNLASTGCGKTLGNTRIMYALANEKTGARFTIALGLRILTLQTGKILRDRMKLDEASLAILVGGSAARTLFELNQDGNVPLDEFESMGSESLEELVEGIVYSQVDGIYGSELGTIIEDKKSRDLLYAPVVTCTVDHLISASENTRGGKHIAPMLRLLTSDLVLDEPDDFDQDDLPALSRLVHFAGLFGSKVLLSSATLTPDLVAGLFNAYQAGRKLWNHNNHVTKCNVVCAWFDENMQSHSHCIDVNHFTQLHQDFVTKRVAKLKKQPVRRQANILPINLPPAPDDQKLHYSALADNLLKAAQSLHYQNHECCPETAKTASIGLIRLANTSPLIQLNKAIYSNESISGDIHIHLCCYHARQLLLLRNRLETRLDRILQRGEDGAIFKHPEINEFLARYSARHHIFIVLATPVAEVGRDHDYDWAIVEPSSMRSIIQLAGRVWRHRPDKIAEQANVLIMDSNIRALASGNNLGIGEAVFIRPGFEEKPNFLLNSHKVGELITDTQLSRIDSIARIIKLDILQPDFRLADLEHAVMTDLLNPPQPNFVSDYWQDNSANRACVHLQRISPFRLQTCKQDDYVCLPDENSQYGYNFKYAALAWKDLWNSDTVDKHINRAEFSPNNLAVTPWLTAEVNETLVALAEKFDEHDLTKVALQYATVRLEENQNGWYFHPWLGFWNR